MKYVVCSDCVYKWLQFLLKKGKKVLVKSGSQLYSGRLIAVEYNKHEDPANRFILVLKLQSGAQVTLKNIQRVSVFEDGVWVEAPK